MDGGLIMKLYWRVKINGKWTWKAANVIGWTEEEYGHIVEPFDGDVGDEVEMS